jgi:hypothetical protein
MYKLGDLKNCVPLLHQHFCYSQSLQGQVVEKLPEHYKTKIICSWTTVVFACNSSTQKAEQQEAQVQNQAGQ